MKNDHGTNNKDYRIIIITVMIGVMIIVMISLTLMIRMRMMIVITTTGRRTLTKNDHGTNNKDNYNNLH